MTLRNVNKELVENISKKIPEPEIQMFVRRQLDLNSVNIIQVFCELFENRLLLKSLVAFC